MCNFISFLRKNRFYDGNLWCVYMALNKHHKEVTGGRRLQDMFLMQTRMRNTTRGYAAKEAATFTSRQLVYSHYDEHQFSMESE